MDPNSEHRQSPYTGLPTIQIFHGYVFLLGASGENLLYEFWRNDLTALIRRNGGEVRHGMPPHGLKVSVTIWPDTHCHQKDKRNKHQCHHSYIYKALQMGDFDLFKHMKSKDESCLQMGKVNNI